MEARAPRPKDRPAGPRRAGRIALGWAAALAAGFGLARALPWCVAEGGIALYWAWLLVPAAAAALDVALGRRGAANAIGSGALRLAASAAVFGALYFPLWGRHYGEPRLLERLGWEPSAAAGDLPRLCEEVVLAANRSYEQAAAAPGPEMEEIDASLDRGLARVAERLGLGADFARPRGRAKPVLLGAEVMSYLGLSGFYNPYTDEANFNRLLPRAFLPEVIGHEKAHQRGIAREDEANLLGFLACASADTPFVRCSGYLFAQDQLLGELGGEAAAALRAKRLPGVQRAFEARAAFWARYHSGRSPVARAANVLGHAVNDTFLKANGVAAGVRSYRTANLLVLFARANGGTCVLAAPGGEAP